MKAFYILLAIILLAGCAPSSEQLTATAVMAKAQTQTAVPTLTPTLTPTSTPEPTATLKPTLTPTPSPAAVGETVEYKNLEITLLEAVTHTQIILSDYFGYDANEGYIFIDLAILVRNRGDKAVSMRWINIYIVDQNSQVWSPFYGGFKTVKLERPFNPMATIKLDIIPAGDMISFESDTYLRLVWPVPEHQDLLFCMEGAPKFVIPME